MDPVLLLYILACLLRVTVAAVTSCPAKTCGNVTIAYPFWLPDQPSSPACGSPPYQVDCRGGRASLARSFRGAYKILRISYADRTVVVANDNLFADGGGCSAPRIDVSASLSLAPFTASKANQELIFLFTCQAPPPSGFLNVTCPGNATFVRLDPRYNASDAASVAGDCTYSVVPVVGFQGASSRDYVQLMREGYLLDWRAPAGDCRACNASGGRCAYDADADAFACVCADGSSRPARCDARKSRSKVILIVTLATVAGLLLTCLVVTLTFRRRMMHSSWFTMLDKNSSNTANVEKLLAKYGSLAPRRYRYSELKKITTSFKHKLGEGGYGAVFRGTLRDGCVVAVKFLHDARPNGEEFLNEVVSIGRTSHVNIVTLLGFCLEGSKRALVYEYMPNGSLEKYVYSKNTKKTLGWEMLQEISVGIARGLEYLHQGCNTRIIHFDIKPHNILLDQEFRPKIADFGMAKLCNPKESILSMADTRGTVGFIAPEVFSRGFGVISTKSDVYSYGMMLLEMVGGRSNVTAYVDKSNELFFPLWIYDQLAEEGRLMDNGGAAGDGEEIARKMALVGLWCIQTTPANRPSMSRVLEMLERSVDELEIPPRPYQSSPSLSHPLSYPSSTTDFTMRSISCTPESIVSGI